MSAGHEAEQPGAFVLTDADVAVLAQAMRRAGVRLLEVDAPGQRLRLKLAPADFAPSDTEAAEPSTLVEAPSMGHFRAAHPAGLFPPCDVGTTVEPAQILGFLQVGLLLLPVTAPCAGRLARILVPDGDLVGYGTALFEISHAMAVGARR